MESFRKLQSSKNSERKRNGGKKKWNLPSRNDKPPEGGGSANREKGENV